MAERRVCGTCGGTRVMHSTPEAVSITERTDEGCWCPRCLAKPVPERCREFVVGDKPKVDRKVAPIGRSHPDTAQVAAAAARLRSGTRRKEVFDLIRHAGPQGRTDDELEKLTGKSHQTISATRNTLMNDGLIVDGGVRRRTQWGNEAIAWVVAGLEARSG